MRIHHLILTSRFAGSERYAIELANAQAGRHAVTLVLRRAALAPRADALGRHIGAGVRVVTVPNWLPSWHARRLLRAERPDLAHAHLGAACRALHGLSGVLRVATLHIHYKPQQHAPLDALVAITPGQLDTLPELLRQRSVHIDNWTAPGTTDSDARARLRASLGVADEVFLLGTLGRIADGKGHDLLAQAFAAAGFGGKVQMVIVGAGDALARLRRFAPSGLHYTGFSAEPKAWLQAMDGFVSAARREPFGLVFLEAMEAGLPILATATEGGRHLEALIERPLVKVADVAALTAALRAFVDERPPHRSYPLERFRIDAKLPAFDDFYAGLMAARKP